MMTCMHCQSAAPVDRFCCVLAELETYRKAIDRAITTLGSEVTAPLALSDVTMRDAVSHTTHELRQVRARRGMTLPARAA